jgi:hypothetical protein
MTPSRRRCGPRRAPEKVQPRLVWAGAAGYPSRGVRSHQDERSVSDAESNGNEGGVAFALPPPPGFPQPNLMRWPFVAIHARPSHWALPKKLRGCLPQRGQPFFVHTLTISTAIVVCFLFGMVKTDRPVTAAARRRRHCPRLLPSPRSRRGPISTRDVRIVS